MQGKVRLTVKSIGQKWFFYLGKEANEKIFFVKFFHFKHKAKPLVRFCDDKNCQKLIDLIGIDEFNKFRISLIKEVAVRFKSKAMITSVGSLYLCEIPEKAKNYFNEKDSSEYKEFLEKAEKYHQGFATGQLSLNNSSHRQNAKQKWGSVLVEAIKVFGEESTEVSMCRLRIYNLDVQ